jgi:hypothetical protein
MALALVVVPVGAADEKKDDDKKPAAKDKADAKDKKDPKDKMVFVAKVQGKLVRFESAQKTLAIQISVPYRNGRNLASKNVDQGYSIADDVQVLISHPPIELDDKGKPKRPSAADLKKAVKGPSELGASPGYQGKWYPGDMDSVKTGQIVTVLLRQKKEASKYTPKGKKDDLADENKPVVTTIAIVGEPRN